jgi:hypothetical protein
VTTGLHITVLLDQSSAGLMTKRFRKQSDVLLFSSLIGTIFGLMDIMGAVMKFFEKQRVDARNRKKKELYLEERKRNRRYLMYSNPSNAGHKDNAVPQLLQSMQLPQRTADEESDSGMFA